jgi:hypothetical protein
MKEANLITQIVGPRSNNNKYHPVTKLITVIS